MAFYRKRQVCDVLYKYQSAKDPSKIIKKEIMLLWTKFWRIFGEFLIRKKVFYYESSSDSDYEHFVDYVGPLEIEYSASAEHLALLSQDELKKRKPKAWDIFLDYEEIKPKPELTAKTATDRVKVIMEKERRMKKNTKAPHKISWYSPQELMQAFRNRRASSGRTFRTFTKIENTSVGTQENSMREEWVKEWVVNGRDPKISLKKFLDGFEARRRNAVRPRPMKRTYEVLREI